MNNNTPRVIVAKADPEGLWFYKFESHDASTEVKVFFANWFLGRKF